MWHHICDIVGMQNFPIFLTFPWTDDICIEKKTGLYWFLFAIAANSFAQPSTFQLRFFFDLRFNQTSSVERTEKISQNLVWNQIKKETKKMKNSSDSDDALKMSNRNTLAFWIIVWLISVLTIGNLLLTLTIFGVLKLGKGMEYLEVNKMHLNTFFFSQININKIFFLHNFNG